MQNSIYSRVQTAGGLSDFTLSTLGGLGVTPAEQTIIPRTNEPTFLFAYSNIQNYTCHHILSLSCALDTMHWLGCCRRWIKENHRQK